MAKARKKAGGPFRGRSRTRKMGMGSGPYYAKKKKSKRG